MCFLDFCNFIANTRHPIKKFQRACNVVQRMCIVAYSRVFSGRLLKTVYVIGQSECRNDLNRLPQKTQHLLLVIGVRF